jgi:hypothetical protein
MRNLREKAAKLGGLALVAAGLSLFAATPAFATGASLIGGGLTDPAHPGAFLTGKQSSTQQFQIHLPPDPGGKCTGQTNPPAGQDSFEGYTYFVDATTVPDPGNLTYGAGGPNNVTGALPLILNDGATPLEAIPTDTSNSLIGSAITTSTLEFDPAYGPLGTAFNVPPGTNIYPGTFNMGASCADNTKGGVADNFWNIKIVVAADSTDPGNNGWTWTIVQNPVTPEVPFAVLLPLSAAGVAGAGAWVLRRRRRVPAATG